jgi:hypothetical protein
MPKMFKQIRHNGLKTFPTPIFGPRRYRPVNTGFSVEKPVKNRRFGEFCFVDGGLFVHLD